MNDSFVGLGEITSSKTLKLGDYMPIGKHKGRRISELIEYKPDYLQWFMENVDRYELDEEVIGELESCAPKAADTVWRGF